MSRRPLVFLALVVSSIVIAACSEASIAAPHRDVSPDSSGTCRSGYVLDAGRCIPVQ